MVLSLSPRVTFESHRALRDEILVVTFRVGGGVFSFWKDYLRDSELPADHPRRKGMKPVFMLNGATNAVPENHTVESISPPKGSIDGHSNWCSCTHLYRAQGTEFTAILVIPRLLGNAGEQQLKDMLLAALGKSNRYIAVGQLGSSRR